MAAELLAQLAPKVGGELNVSAQKAAEILKEKSLGAEPSLIVPLNKARGDKMAIKPSKLKSMAKDLLEASRTDSPKSMLQVYEALTAIADYAKAPIAMTLDPASPSVDDLASGRVRLQVVSLLGSPAVVRTTSLQKLARADDTDAREGGGDSRLGKPDALGFRSLPKVIVTAGLYTAEFAVEVVGGDGKALTAKLPVAVASSTSLSGVELMVSAGRLPSSTALASYALAPGEMLPHNAHASAVEGHHVHVAFKLTGAATAAPHQAFVRFTHALSGLHNFFVAPPERNGGGGGIDGHQGFAVSVSLAEETSTFLQRTGAYEVAIVVGGPTVTMPVLEPLGAITLDFPVAKEKDWPIYSRALLHETDVSLGPLPEKHHTFRLPAPRPPAAISLLFTLLALAPLVGLLYGLRRAGADSRRLPRSGSGKAWCAAYQACVVGIVLLFVTYWAALTMAYTLKLLSVLSLVTIFVGRKALQALAFENEVRPRPDHNKQE